MDIDISNSLSIMNPITTHLLDAGRFCLGNILSQDMELIKVSNVLSYLTSSQHDKKQLDTFLFSKMPFFRKICRDRNFGENIIDKAADILKRHKGTQSK